MPALFVPDVIGGERRVSWLTHEAFRKFQFTRPTADRVGAGLTLHSAGAAG